MSGKHAGVPMTMLRRGVCPEHKATRPCVECLYHEIYSLQTVLKGCRMFRADLRRELIRALKEVKRLKAKHR